jgi:hypothetical protein
VYVCLSDEMRKKACITLTETCRPIRVEQVENPGRPNPTASVVLEKKISTGGDGLNLLVSLHTEVRPSDTLSTLTRGKVGVLEPRNRLV